MNKPRLYGPDGLTLPSGHPRVSEEDCVALPTSLLEGFDRYGCFPMELVACGENNLPTSLTRRLLHILNTALCTRNNLALAVQNGPSPFGTIDLPPEIRDQFSIIAQIMPKKGDIKERKLWEYQHIALAHKPTDTATAIAVRNMRTGELKFRKMRKKYGTTRTATSIHLHKVGSRGSQRIKSAFDTEKHFLKLFNSMPSLTGVVPVIIENDDLDIMESEFVPGITLRKYINALLEIYTRIGPEDSLEGCEMYLAYICDALAMWAENLAKLHIVGYAQGDAKTNNVMVTNNTEHIYYREFVDSGEPIVNCTLVDLEHVAEIDNASGSNPLYKDNTHFHGAPLYTPIEHLHADPSNTPSTANDLRSIGITLTLVLGSMFRSDKKYDAKRTHVCERAGDDKLYFSIDTAWTYLDRVLPRTPLYTEIKQLIDHCLQEEHLDGVHVAHELRNLSKSLRNIADNDTIVIGQNVDVSKPPQS